MFRSFRALLEGGAALFMLGSCAAVPAGEGVNANVRITVLSTNLAELRGTGEWGWSALVELDDYCILFDTGNYPQTVLNNAAELGLDLSCVTDVVLSHHHADHAGGLATLHEQFAPRAPTAFRTVHVAKGMFLPRPRDGKAEGNSMLEVRHKLEAQGVRFRIHPTAAEIRPGIWVTGPIRRIHPEQNYARGLQVRIDDELVTDYIPESQGLSVLTEHGTVVILGCGHAGIINTLDHVRSAVAAKSIHAVMGGFHLFTASDEVLDWVGERLAAIGPQHVMGAHCTGIEPLYRIRAGTGMSRQHAVIGSVGATFTVGEGFSPGPLAR